jgi:hypothetical protein
MQAITPADLNDAYALFGLNDDEVFSVIATAGPVAPDPPPRLHLQAEGANHQSRRQSSEQAPASDVTNMLLASMAAALQKSFMESQGSGKQGGGASQSEGEQGEKGG